MKFGKFKEFAEMQNIFLRQNVLLVVVENFVRWKNKNLLKDLWKKVIIIIKNIFEKKYYKNISEKKLKYLKNKKSD